MLELWQRYGAMVVYERDGVTLLSPVRVHRDQTIQPYGGIYALEFNGTIEEFASHLKVPVSGLTSLVPAYGSIIA